MRIVIVGNGVAGMEAALAVRKREPTWEISLISEESDHFFSRTALMWVFSGQMSHRDIEPLERDAYARLGFRRVRARATGIDTAKQLVFLAGGLEPVPYDRLLIASGSRPRNGPWPGADSRGVGYFVTLQDLAWYEGEVHGGSSRAGGPPRADAHLRASATDSPYRFREVAAERRGRLARQPAIIGGGLIGIEAVEVAVAAGLRPRFFIREEWFWPIALDPRESEWIADRMSRHGVDVHLEHEVERIEADSDGNVIAVRTNEGRYEADCVVIAIGVVPNTSWLAGSEIEIDERGGIVVDESLQDERPGRVRCGRLRIGALVRRNAAPRAALVHGARSGPRSRATATRGFAALPKGRLVQLGQADGHRVHDRRAGELEARRRKKLVLRGTWQGAKHDAGGRPRGPRRRFQHAGPAMGSPRAHPVD